MATLGFLLTILVGALVGLLILLALCAYVPQFDENVFQRMVDMFPNKKKKEEKDE